jgi:hypothetical protein
LLRIDCDLYYDDGIMVMESDRIDEKVSTVVDKSILAANPIQQLGAPTK